ncbi:hypothetical protein BG011_001999, partial [Mortierella polycephala]
PNDNDVRRLRLEPEFSSLFTNASFVRDPAYGKDVAELNEMMIALNGGNRPSNRVNAAAPSHKGHGKHYCVGQAWEPYRVRIFENRMDCSIEGWTTLVSFCVPKKTVTTKSLYKIDGCVGTAHNPTRSMYYSDSTKCNKNGWQHDFQLSTQGTKGSSGMHFLSVWEAFNPHRINVGPGGADFTSTGWGYYDYLPAYTIQYPITPSGVATIKPRLSKISKVHKRGLPVVLALELTIALAAVAYRALQYLQHDLYQSTAGALFERLGDHEEVREVAQGLMGRPVAVDVVRTQIVDGGFEGNLVTIQLTVDGHAAASVNLDERVHYGRAWIREALATSMMDRVPVTLIRGLDIESGRYRGYIYSPI